MESHYHHLEATFMDLSQSQISGDNSTIPQRCLVALIDVNRLKVHMSQFKASIVKEFHKVQGLLPLLSQAYSTVIQELSQARSKHIEELNQIRRDHNQNTHKLHIQKAQEQVQQKSLKIVELVTRVEEMQGEKDRIYTLLKKQTEAVTKGKIQHQLEIQRLNLRINELYSIIHEKTATIDILSLQKTKSKQTLRSYQTVELHDRREEKKDGSSTARPEKANKHNPVQTNSTPRPNTHRLKDEDELYCYPSWKEKLSSEHPFQQVNFAMDPQVMEKISGLVGSITAGNGNSRPKDTEPALSTLKQNHEGAEREQQKRRHRKSSTLETLYKSAMKGCKKSQRIFK